MKKDSDDTIRVAVESHPYPLLFATISGVHLYGFAETQWKMFQKADPPHVKPLLYVYRVLPTGVRLRLHGLPVST